MKINKMQAFLAGMMLQRAIKDKEHRGLDLLGVWAILGLPGLAIAFEIAGFVGDLILAAILLVIFAIIALFQEIIKIITFQNKEFNWVLISYLLISMPIIILFGALFLASYLQDDIARKEHFAKLHHQHTHHIQQTPHQ